LVSESRDEVYKDGNVKSWILAEGLVRQLSLGYRALVVIESRDYMGHLLELLKSAKGEAWAQEGPLRFSLPGKRERKTG